MRFITSSSTCLAALLLAGNGLAAAAEMPSQEEMWKIIQRQQQEIEKLIRQQQETEEKVEATGEALDSVVAAPARTDEEAPASLGAKHGPFAHGKAGETVIGGYGEMHYNNLDSKDEIDFHRAILFLGHEFNDNIRFFSEIEIEHADSSKNGAIELEQA
ncbi:MAG TPA: hypothetical protein ENK49_06915, partial [Gammaproteobacteria bacterium]|nr:hypothetical protein [Gammaproteobacteria bacterium]